MGLAIAGPGLMGPAIAGPGFVGPVIAGPGGTGDRRCRTSDLWKREKEEHVKCRTFPERRF